MVVCIDKKLLREDSGCSGISEMSAKDSSDGSEGVSGSAEDTGSSGSDTGTSGSEVSSSDAVGVLSAETEADSEVSSGGSLLSAGSAGSEDAMLSLVSEEAAGAEELSFVSETVLSGFEETAGADVVSDDAGVLMVVTVLSEESGSSGGTVF